MLHSKAHRCSPTQQNQKQQDSVQRVIHDLMSRVYCTADSAYSTCWPAASNLLIECRQRDQPITSPEQQGADCQASCSIFAPISVSPAFYIHGMLGDSSPEAVGKPGIPLHDSQSMLVEFWEAKLPTGQIELHLLCMLLTFW